MKKKIAILALLSLFLSVSFYFIKTKFYDNKLAEKTPLHETIKNGDIIFQTSLSQQSKAIQLATKSEISHCGIIYKIKDKYYVFEAIQPVTLTPLDTWIKRGQDEKYTIKRLKNRDKILTKETLNNMQKIGNTFLNKDYDILFEWSDDKIYCSELIWKIYKRGANIEVGKLEKLGDFDLSNNIIQSKIRERYGKNIPVNQTVISPQAIFESNLLETIKSS